MLPGKLQLVRLERGLTLRQAAKITGVTKETLSDLERGLRQPHPPTLYKIARGYGIPVRDLLQEEELIFSGEGKPPASEDRGGDPGSLPPLEVPEHLRWALEGSAPEEMEAWARDADTEDLWYLKATLDERARELHARGAKEERWAVHGRRSVIFWELRRRTPQPVAKITRFAPDENGRQRRPLVQWFVPEGKRDEQRARIEARLGTADYDEEEGEAEDVAQGAESLESIYAGTAG